jgi:hypothetical protein
MLDKGMLTSREVEFVKYARPEIVESQEEGKLRAS